MKASNLQQEGAAYLNLPPVNGGSWPPAVSSLGLAKVRLRCNPINTVRRRQTETD